MLAGYSVFSQKRNLPEGLDEDYTVRTGRPSGRELVAVRASLLWDSLPASLHVPTLSGEIESAQVTSPWGGGVSARRPCSLDVSLPSCLFTVCVLACVALWLGCGSALCGARPQEPSGGWQGGCVVAQGEWAPVFCGRGSCHTPPSFATRGLGLASLLSRSGIPRKRVPRPPRSSKQALLRAAGEAGGAVIRRKLRVRPGPS